MTTDGTYYDFRFGDRNSGYYEIRDDGNEIYQNAVFELDGEVQENPFRLRYESGRVLAVRAGDGQWLDFGAHDADHFPSSAYPLLLADLDQRRAYVAVRDDNGEVLGPTVLEREGDTVTETRDGRVLRRFVFDTDGSIVEINWGGPVSRRMASYEEAVRGSALADRPPGR